MELFMATQVCCCCLPLVGVNETISKAKKETETLWILRNNYRFASGGIKLRIGPQFAERTRTPFTESFFVFARAKNVS